MITIRITGARELTENFRQLSCRSRETLTIALRTSLRDVRDRARLNHKFTTRSGETERGIEYDQTGPLSGVIGVTTKIGIYQHEGTGIYGAKGRPIVIRPKNRTALRWATGAGFAFAKRVTIQRALKVTLIFTAQPEKKLRLSKQGLLMLSERRQKYDLYYS